MKMWKLLALVICLIGYCLAGPVGSKRNMPIVQQRNEDFTLTEAQPDAIVDPNEMMIMSSLNLPSNATSIRANITDGFSCESRTYGYYADVDNDCQIFHVCWPVTYPDGKGNSFHWSFICPEETIFSQDSFTCMRPDDMTISCEESYQYYELNRKFGIVESAGDKENSNEAASATAEDIQSVPEPERINPVMQFEETVIPQAKPVNAVKPSRRKPSISYGTQKRPSSSYPLRKIAQAESPSTQFSEDINENIKPVEEEQIKPIVVKFSRRPIPAMSNSFKDKLQNANQEGVISTRTELFNQMRKRPTLFDRKPVEEQEEPKVEQPKIEVEQNQPNFSPMATDLSISNSDTAMADHEIETSESNHVFVAPAEANENPQNLEISNSVDEEPAKVLETFEEIPAVIAEVFEAPTATEEEDNHEATLSISNEKSNVAEEPQIIEELQSDEEVQSPTDAEPAREHINQEQTVLQMPTAEETKYIEEVANADKSETDPDAADGTSNMQQGLRTSAEGIQNINEANESEEIRDDIKSDEAEKSPSGEGIATVQRVTVTGEIQKPEDMQVVEEIQMGNESETPEEINTAEDSHIPVKSQSVEETQNVEETFAVAENAPSEELPNAEEDGTYKHSTDAEEEMADITQSQRTSDEETKNSEEYVNTEENTNDQTAEAAHVVEQPEIYSIEKSKDSDDNLEVQDVTNEEAKTEVAEEVFNNEDQKDHEYIPAAQVQLDESPTQAEEALVVEEPQPVVHKSEESQILEEVLDAEEPEHVEINAKPEQDAASSNTKQDVNFTDIEANEKIESEKPTDSSEAMSNPQPASQEIYENMDESKQSVSGFKPVDPVMAHEAEQLIVDFINTLRKNDFTNETPVINMEHQAGEILDEEQSQKNAEAQQNEEENQETQETNVQNEEQEEKEQSDTLNEISNTQGSAVEDNNKEPQKEEEVEESDAAVESSEPNAVKSLEPQRVEVMKDSAEVSAEEMNLPLELYKIPVQVITTPIQDVPMINEQSHEGEIQEDEIAPNTEGKLVEDSPASSMSGQQQLSIDAIVELVKERLDQMPQDEMKTPMQLEQVIGEAQKDKDVEDDLNEQASIETGEQHQSSHSEEEIVMPIYQRTVKPLQVDVGVVETESLQQALSEEHSKNSKSVTDAKEKTKRSYRSRGMSTPKKDSRKRHFLFKTDSS